MVKALQLSLVFRDIGVDDQQGVLLHLDISLALIRIKQKPMGVLSCLMCCQSGTNNTNLIAVNDLCWLNLIEFDTPDKWTIQLTEVVIID